MVLQHMRENISRFHWILWIVIASFILVYGYDYVQQRESPESVPALRVNGRPITAIEVQRRFQSFTQATQARTPEQRRAILNLVVNGMIEEALLLDIAERLHIVVTPREVDEEIRRQLDQLKEQIRARRPDIPEEELSAQIRDNIQAFLFRLGYPSWAAYRAEVERNLLLQKVQNFLAGPVTVREPEVRDYYRRLYVNARIEAVEINIQRYRDPELMESAVRRYFAMHRDRYLSNEQRKATLLKVLPEGFMGDVFVSDEEIRSYYETHRSEFTLPAEVHARHILVKTEPRGEEAAYQLVQQLLQRIKQGEDFAALAREYSEDPATRDQGGDLGWFSRGRMVKTLEDAAFAAQVGAVVGPIQTEFGYHLLQVLERRPERLRPLEEVREDIRRQLAGPEAQKKAEEKAAELYQRLTGADAPKPEDLADPPRVMVETTDWFEIATPSLPALLRSRIFQLKRPGTWIEPIHVAGDAFYLARLEAIRPPQPLPFERVRDRVEADWKRNVKLDLAFKDAQQLYKKARSMQQDLKKAAEVMGFKASEYGPFPESGPVTGLAMPADWARKVFTLPVGVVQPPERVDDRAYLVFKVLERHAFDEADFRAKYAQLERQLIRQRQRLLVQSVLTELKEHARVERNAQALEQLL